MKDYCSIIKFIEKVKYNITNNKYGSHENLESDFYNINKYIFEDLDNLTESDLSNLCKVHEFLIDKVCKIHSSEENVVNEKLFKNNLDIKNLSTHLKDGKRAFNIYSFNNCNYNYYFIGDLHSDTISLMKILEKCNFFNCIVNGHNIRLIFLGDYVDRGKAHIKMLSCILLLKYIFHENIYLLRGNHDGGTIIKDGVKLCVGKPKNELDEDYYLLYLYKLSKTNRSFSSHMINNYLNFFNSLCNIAFINSLSTTIMAVHGGIPRPRKENCTYYNYINNIHNLTDENIVDNINRSITHNMLWSDPWNNGDNLREDSGRFRFTVDHFEDFRKKLNFDLLVRGHEAEKDGYKKFFNGKLFTIFSSGSIFHNSKDINTETAYKDISPKMLRFTKNGEAILLDINGDGY